MTEFKQGTKRAIRQLYGGICAKCGAVADNVDHVHPKAKGGPGEAHNAQLLCERCNKSLSDSIKPRSGRFNIVKPEPPENLRVWQADCTEKQLTAIQKGVRQWFSAVCVSAGKTMQTLNLYLRGDFDLVLIVVPKTGIRLSWAEDAERLGLTLETVVSGSKFVGVGKRGSEYQMPHGFVLTLDMLPSLINDLQAYGQLFKILGVIDEAHHLGEGMRWTENVVAAFRHCDFVTALSGTPDRADNNRILNLPYEVGQNLATAKPDYTYCTEQALSDGYVGLVIGRFIGGVVTKRHKNGVTENFSYSDDYEQMPGIDAKSMMGERLRLSAVEAMDWQLAAITEARITLMQCREDGHPWAGLIACREIEQAKAIKEHLEARGDKCLLIVGDEDTEAAVELFNSDESYLWAISITKVSEGISISRLRVGVLLSNWTTRQFFEQLRGRLCRLYKDIPQIDQTAYFYVPADPRIKEMALTSNQMALHEVSWLNEISDENPETADKVKVLREQLEATETIDIGTYSLEATATIEGAAINDEFLSEDKYRDLREKLAEEINPFTAARAPGDVLTFLDEV